MNIYEKMSAITCELNAVAKNLKVGEGKSQYKAVGEADVLAAVKPIEQKNGVYSYPAARRIIESDILTGTNSYGNQTQKMFLRIETVYRFVDIEKPESYIEITTYGDGIDTQDKAPGKAMTYGDKYALLKAYKIITGDDPDQYMSEENQKITRASQQPKAEPKQEPKVEPKQEPKKEPVFKLNEATADGLISKDDAARFHVVCAGDNDFELFLWSKYGVANWTEMKHADALKLSANWDAAYEKFKRG